MPGLLDILGGNFGADDPRQAAYLALASGLLGGKGSFNSVLGKAMMGAQETMQQSRKAQQQSELTKLQMDEIRRKADEAKQQQERTQQAIASFPQAGIVQGPPTEQGEYPTRQPTRDDFMNWGVKSYGLDPKLAQFGFGAAERLDNREDQQRARADDRKAAASTAMERMQEQARLASERQREAAQQRTQLAQIMASLRPPRAEEPPVMVIGPDGKPQWASRKDAVGKPAYAPGEKLRPIPAAVNTAIIDNQMGKSRLDRAITLLEGTDIKAGKESRIGDKDATGWKGFLPDAILTRVDPKGVDARAEVADIGSLKIHDRSGAAVTISESPRLMPFIPKSTDDNQTALKKLRRLKTEMEQAGMALAEVYSEEQGYRPNPIAAKGSGKWTIEVEQ